MKNRKALLAIFSALMLCGSRSQHCGFRPYTGLWYRLPLARLNSQFYYTPQSLSDSPPTLVGQLIFLYWLSVVYSSLPGVGRVRRSWERVRKILTASPWGGTIVDDSTPQSLRDSPPILVGQLVCCLLSVVYSTLPGVGRVRRSQESAQI